ncbi:MAG TPA: DUF1501 domain-containing protein, partial [Gemmataceae bacterium]|nr:DUF1501 domain-containing protein [Gemmataceae bacterium]
PARPPTENLPMLTLFGPARRFCDGISRRSFLTIGGLAVGGLTLPALLRAEERSGRRSHKAVIMVYLSGGLAHQDSFDLKPNAPAEVRGEFKPIATNVPGVQIGELLPRTARVMDKIALVRSIHGLIDEHSSWQNLTGFPMNTAKREGRPNFGSVVAKLQGSTDRVMPPFVDLFPTMQHRPYNIPGPGHLGRAAAGVKVDGDDVAVMKLRGLSQAELADRRKLLERFDGFRRAADSAELGGMQSQYRRAFDVLTSSKLVQALDVTREPEAVRERYGRGSPKHLGDGAPMWNDQLLMARRLVEAGARVVTVAYGFWDTHGGNFKYLRRHLPLFDQGISALVEDIYARGMDKEVTVVVWGEFGRTPKINKDAGRDHWARANGALLSGGGMRVGQVIGSTDSTAAVPKDSPVHYQDVLATVYHNLGINPHSMVEDVSGRPAPILPGTARVIDRLV